MDKQKFIAKYFLIIILILIVVTMIIVKIINKDQPTLIEPEIKINPTPTIISTNSNTVDNTTLPYEEINDANPDYPLQSLLPYTTKDFIVEEYSAPLTLKVKVLIPSIDQAQKEVNDWIIGNGLEAGEHHFVWVK
ncbi:MAG: hypothetical protein WCG91_03560 [Candidatus Shapirobacteria bacterium]